MKKILIIIPYEEIYPPMNGGMLRCFHILRQLAKNNSVDVIMHQDAKDFKTALKKYPELSTLQIISTGHPVLSRDIFSIIPSRFRDSLKFRVWKRSWKGPADSNFLKIYPVLKNCLKQKDYDIIILENLSSLHLVPVIKRYTKARLIYDAHNVDSKLAESFNGKLRPSAKNYKQIAEIESGLYKVVNGIIACSEMDLETLRKLNKGELKGKVIANGVEITGSEIFPHTTVNLRESLIFCGSMDYEPNREGLIWFCEKVFPMILLEKPDAKLIVIGKGDPGKHLATLLCGWGILFQGMVDDLDEYYSKSCIAIVPLHTGSGTRLKLLEAMSKKVAVVSTTKGAEGIEYEHKKNIFIADSDVNFSNIIIELLDHKEEAEKIADNAYKLVKQKYNWNIIGKELENFLEQVSEENSRN